MLNQYPPAAALPQLCAAWLVVREFSSPRQPRRKYIKRAAAPDRVPEPLRKPASVPRPLGLACRLLGLAVSFLRPFESPLGMFQCLSGKLVSGLVIFFPVVHGGNAVRVRGEFVEFGSSLVRVIWHCVPSLDFISHNHPIFPYRYL